MNYIEILSALQDKQIEVVEKNYDCSISINLYNREDGKWTVVFVSNADMIDHVSFNRDDRYKDNKPNFDRIMQIIEPVTRQANKL